MKKNISLFFIFLLNLLLFAKDNNQSEVVYAFRTKQNSYLKIKVKPYTSNEGVLDNIKLIQILRNMKIIGEYKSLELSENNLGEGYQEILIGDDCFVIKQSFRDRNLLVISLLTFKYIDDKIILTKYEEAIVDVYADVQDFISGSFELSKGIPIEYISDELIYIFHSSLLLNEFSELILSDR